MQQYYSAKSPDNRTGFVKKLLFIPFFLILSGEAFCQKEANTWYFGNRAGLDFNQTPPRALYNSKASSYEGFTSISDKNGELIFYSNGITVVNRQHQPMKNGAHITGDISSTMGTVIVPLPGNDSIYYLFTTGAAFQETRQLLYNIINIKGDNGLGEVVQSNILIEDVIFEKIAAVRHCNKKDVWIVVHKWDSDEYHSYLVTAAGLNPVPVVSKAAVSITGNENNGIGSLKFAANGTKLAAVHAFENNLVELMDFNNLNGVISNPVVFQPSVPRNATFTGSYGVEFSPNGRLLYVSVNSSFTEPCLLYQFDISSNNATSILATKQLIANATPFFAGALQMGPDQKIYMAMWNDTSISVIENPDVFGAGCNFKYNKIFVGAATREPVQFGLPNFIQSYFDSSSNPYDFKRTSDCLNKNVAFKISRTAGIDSVKWDFGDGQQSQALQPVNNYANPGFYNVQLIVYKIDCSGSNDTVNRRIWIAATGNFLGKDTSGCDNLALSIGVAAIDGANYLWNNGAVSNTITTTNFGLYWLELNQNGCKLRDSLNVFEKQKPAVNIGNDTFVCNNKPIVLNAGNNIASGYLWNTGETSPFISINKAGIYYVTVTGNLCAATDTVIVFPGDCDIFIPNTFTPNGDGINDQFGIANSVKVQDFSMKIYNRYGQVIFSTKNVAGKWDGKFKGKYVHAGSYPWSIIYINGKGYTKWLNGSVLVLH
jgi:gliding motility-associated-like protein